MVAKGIDPSIVDQYKDVMLYYFTNGDNGINAVATMMNSMLLERVRKKIARRNNN